MNAPLKKQHLIDPEICIRCNTCEETCPVDAVTHDDNNYVVNAEICNYCMDCIAPCPTGAIDNWRIVAKPYSLQEQFSWSDLPPQAEVDSGDSSEAVEALEDEIGALLEEARKGLGGKAVAPHSASKPTVKLYVTGPFGATFLHPNDPASNIIMICTGTGSAPFRAFTERRRRAMLDAPGRLLLFFGARRPEELPYFGPLQKVPEKLLAKHFCYSRVPGEPRVYVQDRIRSEGSAVAALLTDERTHVYICGLQGMESGVDEAFSDVCRGAALEWAQLKTAMREDGRYHVETY